MEIFFKEALEEVVRVIATGAVEIRRDTWIATADRAEYYPRGDTGVLSGDVFFQQGESELRGERFQFNGRAGQLKIEGNVRGKIWPGEGGIALDD